VADVDPAPENKVFDVPQAEREPRIDHDDQTNDLGRGVKAVERVIGLAYPPDLSPPQLTGNFALTMPFGRIALKF
jgi:hypothetical protein